MANIISVAIKKKLGSSNPCYYWKRCNSLGL